MNYEFQDALIPNALRAGGFTELTGSRTVLVPDQRVPRDQLEVERLGWVLVRQCRVIRQPTAQPTIYKVSGIEKPLVRFSPGFVNDKGRYHHLRARLHSSDLFQPQPPPRYP